VCLLSWALDRRCDPLVYTVMRTEAVTEIPLPFYPFHLWFSHVYYEIVAVTEIPLPFCSFQSGLPSVDWPGTAWQRSRVGWSCPDGFSKPSKKWRVRVDGHSRVHASPAVMRAGGCLSRVHQLARPLLQRLRQHLHAGPVRHQAAGGESDMALTNIPLLFHPFHLWFSHVYYEIVAVTEIPLCGGD
jgi:hypothetical protein